MKRRIRKAEVMHKMSWSASTLNQKVADGDFIPTREGIIPYWLESEVDAFIDRFFTQTNSDESFD